MNKGELISTYANLSETKPADAKNVVETFSKIFSNVLLSGEEVTIPGVGKLKVHTRPARAGRNPKTGEAISIPSKRVVKFIPSAQFEDLISEI